MRQDLGGAGGTSRRLEISTRGEVAPDGALALELTRARLESRSSLGDVEVADTAVVAGEPATRTAEEQTWTRLLESLRGARVNIRLDPSAGILAVDGLDAALSASVERDATLAVPRAGLRLLLADSPWRRDLAAAGLCAVPPAVRDGGGAERLVRVHVPGRGETTMRIRGSVGKDTSGLPAARLTGSLAAHAEFDGDAGAEPPEEVGAVTVAGVTGAATTSYPPAEGPPLQGEWTITTPFAGGLTLTTTTSFKLVLK